MSNPDDLEFPDENEQTQGNGDGGSEDEAFEGQTDEGTDGTDAHQDDETGDEAGSESLGGADTEGETQPVKGSRAQERIRAQQEALRAEREEKARLAVELERVRQQQQAYSQQQLEAQQRAYLESLDPMERQQVLMEQRFQEMQRQQQILQAQLQEQTDRAQFQAKAATNPMVGKYLDRVEAELQKLRAVGQNAPRETLLAYLIGQDMLSKTPTAAAKQRAASASRVKSAQGSPPNSRGNARVGRSDGDSIEELEARLFGRSLDF